jgi:thymidylate synthase
LVDNDRSQITVERGNAIMIVIQERGVNEAWHTAKAIMKQNGVPKDSRNGPTLEVPEPVTTCFFAPTECVLFDPVRDSNPFFSILEPLWMLSGRADVAWISQFNSNIHKYSDDGKIFHGAYGFRWRNYFAFDQLEKIISILINDSNDRRAVLQMWTPSADLWTPDEIIARGQPFKDLPCNTNAFYKIRDGHLYQTVCNRSNDIVWGLYGANITQFSMLQEYLAGMIGCKIGPYHHLSDSWHAYNNIWEKQDIPENDHNSDEQSPYTNGRKVWHYPIITHASAFDIDLHNFMEATNPTGPGTQLDSPGYINPFFYEIAIPMYSAWMAWKKKDFREAYRELNKMPDNVDWKVAAEEWLERREKK